MSNLLSKVGMSCFISRFFAAVLLCGVVPVSMFAQTANVPNFISYQGQISGSSGVPISGDQTMTITLYSDPQSKNIVWQGTYNVTITKGLFNVMLGKGAYPLPASDQMNKQLWVGVRVGEGEEMKPLTELTSVPYALNVPDKSITMEKLAPDVVLGMGVGHLPTPQITGDRIGLSDGTTFDPNGPRGTTTTVLHGNASAAPAYSSVDLTTDITNTLSVGNGGTGDITLNAGEIVTGNGTGALNTITGTANQVLRIPSGGGTPNFGVINLASSAAVGTTILGIANGGTGSSGGAWLLNGNTINTAGPIIGTLAGSTAPEVVFSVKGLEAMEFSLGTSGFPNITAAPFTGSSKNQIINASGNCSITAGSSNKIDGGTADFIGGGDHNKLLKDGGNVNLDDAIVNGSNNVITDGLYSIVGGGFKNIMTEVGFDGIASGFLNTISNTVPNVTIFSSIAGGKGNLITGDLSFIGGGGGTDAITASPDGHTINSNYSSIVGGMQNILNTGSDYSFIGGGYLNNLLLIILLLEVEEKINSTTYLVILP